MDPDPGLYNQFWKKKFEIILEKNNFLWNKYIFLTIRTNCNLKKFLSSELLINILNLTSFASILTYICMCGSGSVFQIRIRIQEAPEYGSNMDPDPDPDPQHW